MDVLVVLADIRIVIATEMRREAVNTYQFFLGGPNLRLNDIEIISVVALSDDHILGFHFLLKHGIEDFIHLLPGSESSRVRQER